MAYLKYGVFENEEIACSKCKWKGLGSELKLEGFSDEHFIIDLSCPNCHEHIGHTQPPTNNEG